MLSDDSDTEPQFVHQPLNSSGEEIIHELSEEEDCDRSGDVSDQSEEIESKITVRNESSGRPSIFAKEDQSKLAVQSQTEK